ncbi:MAG: flagellar hook-associated protein FlgK [Planctomycetota bacterium]
MSLFSSLNLARLALGAHQTAIQTVGQNIANAGTEGYARQRVQMAPTPSDDLVYARLGTGVRVERIERIVDEHLEATLRGANSDLASLSERSRVYSLVESVFNDLNGGGLSEALGRFFDALEDVANQPEDTTARGQLLEQAETLAQTFNYVDGRLRQLRRDFDDDVVSVTQNINRLANVVANLNNRIVEAEDGGVHPGTANDLRTQRDAALTQLSQLVNIKTIENTRGAVQVISGSQVLVFESSARAVNSAAESDGDISFHELRFELDGQPFRPTGGRIATLLEARDELAPELRASLDTLARSVMSEMNKLHASGEGLARPASVRSAFSVADADAALGAAGYPYAITNGRLSLEVVLGGDGSRETYEFDIDATGATGNATSLNALVAAINSGAGADHPELSARVTVDGFLEIRSTSETLSFTFRADDTGFLAATGINALFSGTNARDMQVAAPVAADARLFAAGLGGGVGDNRVALAMLELRDAQLLGPAEQNFESYYNSLIGEIGIEGAEAQELLSSQEAIQASIQNQRDALSGVNVDEEAIALIQFQRAYQGAARFLNVVDRLLETLINSV